MNLSPEHKLQYLKEYMHLWIDGWENGAFPEFRFQYYLSIRRRLLNRSKPLPDSASKLKRIRIRPNQGKGTGIFLFISNVKWECCMYCGKHFDDHVIKTVDHIIAKAKGGLDGPKVIACKKCNGWKNDLSLAEFFTLVGCALGSHKVHRPPGMKAKHLTRIRENIPAIARCVLSKCGLDAYYKTQERS